VEASGEVDVLLGSSTLSATVRDGFARVSIAKAGRVKPAVVADLSPTDVKDLADFWNDLAAEINVIPAVVARWRRLLDSSSTTEGFSDKGAGFGIHGPIPHLIVQALLSMFNGQPPFLNHVAMQAYSEEYGPVLLTLQKRGKFTPIDARNKAEAEAKRLHVMCKAVGVDPGPLQLVPRRAQGEDLPAVEVEPTDEWLWIDIRHNPNIFHCDRCGGQATAPTPCSMEDYSRFQLAFAETHRKCEPGDAEALGRKAVRRGG